MTHPLITVGLICFNAEKTLMEAIGCINAQTWPNLEIIIVDDVSTDGTWEIIQNLAASDRRIRIFRNDINSGAGKSRKRVVEEAKGEFIAFFDDDDTSDSTRIQKQYDRITAYEKEYRPQAPVICHVSRQVEDENGNRWYFEALGATGGKAPHGKAMIDCLLLGKKTKETSGNIGSCMLMARTSDYRGIGNFDPAFRRAQDTEIVIRWARAGAHFVGTKEHLITQKLTVTSRKVDIERKCVLLYLERNKDYLDKAGMYDYVILWTKGKFSILSGDKIGGGFLLFRAFCKKPTLFIKRALQTLSFAKYNSMISGRYASSAQEIKNA